MFTPAELERLSNVFAPNMRELEERIMADVIRRLKINGSDITRAADWQLHRAYELGMSKREITKTIQKSLGLSYKEIKTMYRQLALRGYARDAALYKYKGIAQVPFGKNEGLQQLISAVAEQTYANMQNITQSLGFAARTPAGTLRFQPIADYYQKALDKAMLDISSGAFDYNSVLKRTVSELTNSGLRTVDYATGWSNRVDVAARRAVMTGMSQLTAKVNEQNAEALDTEYFEVTYHGGARPSHQVWQGRVYSKNDLARVCGLGAVDGLCGANCYHDYFPFIKGVSQRTYTDGQLDELNRKENTPTEYGGRKYTAYEATQRQRKLETTMRAQREKIDLLQKGGAKDEDIINARAQYRATSAEYSRFSNAMGIPQQRDRVYVDGLGNIGVGKYTPASEIPEIKPQPVGAQVVDTVSTQEREQLLREPEGTAAFKNGVDNPRKSGIIEIEEGSSSNDIEWLPKGERISTDEYKELRDYAASKGISLSGFKVSDVDTDLIRSTIGSAVEITTVFPELLGTDRKLLTFELSTTMPNCDFARTIKSTNHLITLNGNAFRNGEKLSQEYSKLVDSRWFVQGTDSNSIIKHELGHLYQFKHNISNEKIIDIAIKVSGINDKKALFSFLKENLSDYSGSIKDGSEIISEVFSDFFGSSKTTTFSKDFMSELMKLR